MTDGNTEGRTAIRPSKQTETAERRFVATDHSLYFEDLAVGQVFRSPSRTLSEADLTMFSMLSGDWNQVHADAEHMHDQGERLLHGALGIAVITGLMDRAGWFAKSAVAMTSLDDWKFLAPLRIGDTVTADMEILAARKVSAGDKGFIDRRFTLHNQHREKVQAGRSGFLIKLADTSR